MLDRYPLFDSHLHIIDRRFPVVANSGYLPPEFTCEDYLRRMAAYRLCGGVIVSASFQQFDQHYLVAALRHLGSGFVGVTQLPASASDEQIVQLNSVGVRAVRFNLRRGGSAALKDLKYMAARVHEIAKWHIELYADAHEVRDLTPVLTGLPCVSIDHLGLSELGLKPLIQLAAQGVRVKASGFGRVDFEVGGALGSLYNANPDALMFGSDLPCTRAPRAYSDDDFTLVADTLGERGAKKVFSDNAIALYKPKIQGESEKEG